MDRPYMLGGMWYDAAEKKLYAPMYCETHMKQRHPSVVCESRDRRVEPDQPMPPDWKPTPPDWWRGFTYLPFAWEEVGGLPLLSGRFALVMNLTWIPYGNFFCDVLGLELTPRA